MSAMISLDEGSEDDSILNPTSSVTHKKSLIGKYVLVKLLNITLTFWVLFSFHNLQRSEPGSRSWCQDTLEKENLEPMRQQNVLDIWHWNGFAVFQLSFVLTLVMRYYAKAEVFFSSKFHYCVICSTTMSTIQLIADVIYSLFYNSESYDLILISLTQLLFIFCYVNILQCPCKYCQGAAVVHISYKDRTTSYRNHQRCNLRLIREKLKIPVDLFIIYDYPEVNYSLNTPCRTRCGFVSVNEEHTYVIKAALLDSEESDFNKEDSVVIWNYMKGTAKKTPEVATILLNHHPLMENN